jgi:hypothetical protein
MRSNSADNVTPLARGASVHPLGKEDKLTRCHARSKKTEPLALAGRTSTRTSLGTGFSGIGAETIPKNTVQWPQTSGKTL